MTGSAKQSRAAPTTLDCFVASLLGRKSLKNGVILPTSSLKLSSKAGRCLIHRSQLAMTSLLSALPQPRQHLQSAVTVGGQQPHLGLIIPDRLHGVRADAAVGTA